ncbi:MAG: hypothetical protein ACHRHE_05320 [Tepidisphaerales bacterium]
MGRRTFAFAVACSMLVGCASGRKTESPKSELPPPPKAERRETPENKLQEQIAAVLAAGNEEQYYKRVGELFERTRELGWSRPQLVGAVIDYSTQISGAEELGRYNRMLTNLDIPRPEIISVAAARLDTAQGTAADAGRNLLRYAAPPDPRGRKDFSHFKPYLETHASPPPARLVLWMYEHDPAAAMWLMRDVYGANMTADDFRSLSLGEHVISEILFRQQAGLVPPGEFDQPAVDQLARLALYRQWWVRLYVANVLLKNPPLRKPQVLDMLRNDADELVKATVTRIG